MRAGNRSFLFMAVAIPNVPDIVKEIRSSDLDNDKGD